MCELDILQYVSFRVYIKYRRSAEDLTLSVPFSRTEALKGNGNKIFYRLI